MSLPSLGQKHLLPFHHPAFNILEVVEDWAAVQMTATMFDLAVNMADTCKDKDDK